MAFRLEVPSELHRNSPVVAADGYEETGLHLLNLAARRLGLESLAGLDVLDIGCGVRFAQTIVNRGVAIRSYTGIEVYRPIVDFMREHLEPFDSRFRFIHWDVHNAFYNSQSPRRPGDEPGLPVDRSFDIVWLYSVFTHLDEVDARAMLTFIRRVVRPTGTLLFTAFIDEDLDGFENRDPAIPLGYVFFGRRTMEGLIQDTRWKLREFYPGGPRPFVQPCFKCTPEVS
jgi:SAM-dependent methyltransferase